MDNRPGKRKNSKEVENNTKKRVSKKSTTGIIFSVAILAICAVGVWNYKSVIEYFKARLPLGFERMLMVKEIQKKSSDSLASLNSESIATEKGEQRVFAQGGIMFLCEDDKLKAFSPEGEAIWEKSFKAESPYIVSIEKSFVVADLSAGDIYILEADGSISAKLMKQGRIDSIRISEGQVGILLEKTNEAIIFDKSLKSISKLKLPIGNMTNWGFSAPLKIIAMSIVAIQDNELVSCVHQFDEGGELEGSITIKDAVVYSFEYNKDMLYAVADKGVYAYKMPSCTASWHNEFQRSCVAYDMSSNGECSIGYAGYDGVDKGYTFEGGVAIYDNMGRKNMMVSSVSGAASFVKRIKGGVIAIADKKAYLISDKGKVVSVHSFDAAPLDVLKLDDSHLGFVFNGRVEVIKCLL